MSLPPVRESLNKDEVPRAWVTWFTEVGNRIDTVGQAGDSSSRPTSGNFVGRCYFDSTLGYPIWVSAIDGTTKAATWVSASGAEV
jgi:hypothetical protein